MVSGLRLGTGFQSLSVTYCDLGKSQDSVSLSISVSEMGMTVPASQVAGKFLRGDAWKVPTAVPGAQGELW